MRFDQKTVDRWKEKAIAYLTEKEKTVDDITTGSLAWQVAHRVGIVFESYTDKTVKDVHIKTALQQIFPKAVFKDKYLY